MPEDLAENYLGAINGALNNPNMASDMKIPGAQQYTGVVLDRELARYLAGEITVDEALANIEAGWEEITEDFGRDDQIKAQALALGTRQLIAPVERLQRRHCQPGTCPGWHHWAATCERVGGSGSTAIRAPTSLRRPLSSS